MTEYSAETRVEPTWLGWLTIAQDHYEAAIKKGDKENTRIARAALREAGSMFPNLNRFAAAAALDSSPQRKR